MSKLQCSKCGGTFTPGFDMRLCLCERELDRYVAGGILQGTEVPDHSDMRRQKGSIPVCRDYVRTVDAVEEFGDQTLED